MVKRLLFSIVLFSSVPSIAKTKVAQPAATKVPASTVTEAELPLLNDDYYKKMIKGAKESKRRTGPASTDVPAIENKFSEDFKTIRKELIGDGTAENQGVKTAADLDALIVKYSGDAYVALSPQAKFVALQLRGLAPFKGFIFRAKEYIGRHDATRTMIVSLLRAQNVFVDSFFLEGQTGVNHWEVVFKYLTEPQTGMGPAINTDKQLEVFIREVANAANTNNSLLAALVAGTDGIWWDNKIYASFAQFVSEKDRYIYLGKPELYSLMATSSLTVSGLFSTAAYSLDGLQNAIAGIGNLFGIQTILNLAGPEGMSSRARVAILNQNRKLFAKHADGDAWMKGAYQLLLNSVRSARTSYELTLKLPEGTDNLFDPRVAFAFSRIMGTSLENIDSLFTRGEVASTVVNGELVHVNIAAFYSNPPAHLNVMYPIEWEQGPAHLEASAWGRTTMRRNYRDGMAKAWKCDGYKTLFPDLCADNGKKTNEIPRYVRVLSQSWGAAAFALPLSMAIF